jgi:hypothetical protein
MAIQTTKAEITEFLAGLRSYRKTLPEGQQRLLDAMIAVALEKKAEAEEVQAYWVDVNPVGPVGGPGAGGVAVNPYGPAGGPGAGAIVW